MAGGARLLCVKRIASRVAAARDEQHRRRFCAIQDRVADVVGLETVAVLNSHCCGRAPLDEWLGAP